MAHHSCCRSTEPSWGIFHRAAVHAAPRLAGGAAQGRRTVAALLTMALASVMVMLPAVLELSGLLPRAQRRFPGTHCRRHGMDGAALRYGSRAPQLLLPTASRICMTAQRPKENPSSPVRAARRALHTINWNSWMPIRRVPRHQSVYLSLPLLAVHVGVFLLIMYRAFLDAPPEHGHGNDQRTARRRWCWRCAPRPRLRRCSSSYLTRHSRWTARPSASDQRPEPRS